jgi:HD-GYP domain-containing protein (c-di-GMP phosphodiesterase class II)
MEHLAVQIASAVHMRALYPENHPRVIQGVQQMLAALRTVMEDSRDDSVTYILLGADLIVGDQVIRTAALPIREFIAILRQRGIERLTVASGLDFEEAQTFVQALATGESLRSSSHIILGRARVLMEEDPKAGPDRRELSVEQLEVVREAWARFRVERKLPVDHLEELVWSLIDSVSRTTRAMLPLAPLKEHDEYTFVHSINVALLVLAQARSFGISGPILHEFGMAGLLHDIGKLTVPLEILNKPGKLECAEWEVMKRHAPQGAWHLTEIGGTPALSVIVAFEHHLRYDGQPNYPLLHSPRLPNLASRMTSIADTFDAMSTVRPYQQPVGRAAAFEVLRKQSSTVYDPLLVANFIRILETDAAPPGAAAPH